MNFMEYVCRGVIRSEDAIRHLNKRVNKLAKCCSRTNAAVLCFGVASALTLWVIAEQDKEIQALKKRMSALEGSREPVENAADDMEEKEEQGGA